MLKIDTNMTIKMSRGDDVKFPLFVNKGNRTQPIRYTFKGRQVKPISFTYARIKEVSVDSDTWTKVVTDYGDYTFIYSASDNSWKLDSNIVDLLDYGITYTLVLNSSLQDGDVIIISYEKGDGCEVYFNIYELKQPNKNPIFTKTFTSDDDLWRGKFNQEEPNGDIKIELLHNDPLNKEGKTLADIPEGEYMYQLKAKVLDDLATQKEGSPQYVLNTLTNRLKLYIIDDDYSERLW